MANPFQAYREAKQFWGKKVGQQWSIYNVDYTALNQTPTLVNKLKYKVETVTDKFAQVNAPDVEFYAVEGQLGILQPGTLMSLGVGYNTIPDVTISSYEELGAIIAFKTTRTGDIYNGINPIFQNIRFDFLPRSAFPGSPLDRELESSLNIPSMQAVMFKRDLWTTTRDAEGLFLHVTDDDPVLVWQIRAVTALGNIYILDMERNAID